MVEGIRERKGTKRAVEELVELPASNPYKENLLEILANWRKNLELRDNISREEQEDMMNLSAAYLKQKHDWKQEGRQEGERLMILSLLEVRFGTLDSQLSESIDRILNLPALERTQILLSLSNLSKEQLLERLS